MMFNLSYFPLPIPRQADLSTAIDSWLRRLLIRLISAYQRYLSPHKGYSCAHRLLHGGESCSCYVKNALTETDLLTAIAQSKTRFAACTDAAETLAAQANSDDDPSSSSPTHYPRRTFIYYSLVGFTLPFFVRRNHGQCCASLGQFLFRDHQRRQREDQQRRYYQDRQRRWEEEHRRRNRRF
jgi:putative component of membrane protein insertase Oxa1/YidC/SpoIIIJ protein YidD